MDYQKSKEIIDQGASAFIESNKNYQWFKEPATIYELETLKLLHVKGISTFEPLREYPNLKELEFGTTDSKMTIATLRGLEYAANLEKLVFVSMTTVQDHDSIAVISAMKNLKELGLYFLQNDLPAGLVLPLPNLKSISLAKTNYKSLRALPQSLEYLNIRCNEIDDIAYFETNTSVKNVCFGLQTCQFITLDSFRVFPNLEKIRLIGPKKLNDISYAKCLRHLKIFEANFSAVADLSGLFAHSSMEELYLRASPIESITEMGTCNQLKKLYLEKTKLKSIEGIQAQFPILEVLWIWNTKVKNLDALAGFASLKNLDVTMLKPKSWDFIATLTGLETLDLCKTSFSDVGLLQNLLALKKLRLAESEVDMNSTAYLKFEQQMEKRGVEIWK